MCKLAIIFLSVILAACGGGGGNDSSTAVTPAPTATQAPANTAPTTTTTPAAPATTAPTAAATTSSIQVMINQVAVANDSGIYLIRSGDVVTLQAASGLSNHSSSTVDANGVKANTSIGIRTLSSTKYEFSLTGAAGNVTTLTFSTLNQVLKFKIV